MSRAPTLCTHPGCWNLTPSGLCPDHRAQQRKTQDARRPNSTERGYDHRWARTRGRYLQHHPVCEDPHCAEASVEVHHLDGLGPLGPDGHRWANLRALCPGHHAELTGREQRPGTAAWRAHY